MTRHHTYEVLTRLKVEARSGRWGDITDALANRVWPKGIEYAGTPPYDGSHPPNGPASPVYLLTVDHKDGTTHWVCTSRKIATQHLFEDYVKEYWADVFGKPVPDDHEEVVERYFQTMTDTGQEFYHIEPLELLTT